MAFYDRMADTATRLLTKFGKSVTFERVTSVFNPITGMDTSRTTETTDTVGVEIPINQALIDGTRVQVGDRFFVVDASFEPTMSDRIQDASFVGAVVPMEPGGWYLVNIPSNAEVSGQTVSKTAPVGVTSFTSYTGRNVTLYDTTTWDGHHRAFEFRVNSISTTNAGSALVECIVNEGSAGGDSLRLRFNGITNLWTVVVNGNPFGTTYAGTIGGHIGVSVHAQSGDVTLWFASGHVDKQVIAALGGLFHHSHLGIDVRGISTAGAGGTTAGDSFSATLVSDYSQFERDYSSNLSMRDLDGTLITRPALSDSWAIVAIEPINPAGTPVAYRVQVRK